MDLAKFAGKVIKDLRLQKNITQEELAKHLGIVKSAVANYESGYRSPKQDTLFALAEFFNVSVDVFFPSTTNSNNPKKAINIVTDSSINQDDVILVKKINSLSANNKEYIIKTVDHFYDIDTKEENDSNQDAG